jgi:hypothetical protein
MDGLKYMGVLMVLDKYRQVTASVFHGVPWGQLENV